MLPTEEELNEFNDSVSEVSRLIQGLKEGTITPDYIKGKQDRGELLHQKKELALAPVVVPVKDKEQEAKDIAAADQKQERLVQKVEELKANRWRKIKARERYTAHLHEGDGALRFETDYAKWDMWCPSDDEDDLFNSIPPNTPQFRAMEKDIDQRHTRMIEQRQLAERQRVAGNVAFNSKQYSEALRCYETGIESQKSSMTLHANAALAALKMHCNVSAIEHCDKVLHIADVLHDTPNHPLCGKAYQRRACAYRSLQQPRKALADLEAAALICPTDSALLKDLAAQRVEISELDKQKAISSALRKDDQIHTSSLATSAVASPLQPQQRAPPKGLGSALPLPSHTTTTATAAATATSKQEQAPKLADAVVGDVKGGGERVLDLGKLRRVELLSQRLATLLAPATVSAGSSSSCKDNATSSPESRPASTGSVLAGAVSETGPEALQQQAGVAAMTQASSAEVPSGGGRGGRQAGSASAGLSDDVTVIARQLQQLLANDDMCCVHFRQCGGLQTTVDQVFSSGRSTTALPHTPALLLLLNASCMNDSNLQRLMSLSVLPEVTRMLLGGGSERDTCAAAGVLLCTVVTLEAPRKEVSQLLASDPGGVTRLMDLLLVATPTQQAVLLTLLGNCAVDVPCKQFLAAIMLPASKHVTTILQLLTSPHPEVAERAITLLSNACGDEEMRRRLHHLPEILEAILTCALANPPSPDNSRSTTPTPTTTRNNNNNNTPSESGHTAGTSSSSGSSVPSIITTATSTSSVSIASSSRSRNRSSSGALSRAACTTLYNLCLEPSAQAAVAVSASLPGLLDLLSDATDMTRLARVCGVLSRVAKHPLGMAALVALPCMEALVDVLLLQLVSDSAAAKAATAAVAAAACTAGAVAAAVYTDTEAVAAEELAARALESVTKEACVRTLTLMLAAEEDGAGARRLVKLGGVGALLGALGNAGSSKDTIPGEAILGNAALCLGYVAKHAAHLPALRAADAVAPLVRVAYEGKGNTASKNAAIALARLAHDPVMMERLRELHGLEIIYKYVKP